MAQEFLAGWGLAVTNMQLNRRHRYARSIHFRIAVLYRLLTLLWLRLIPSCALPVEILLAAAQPTSGLVRTHIRTPVIVNLPLGTKPEGLSAGRTFGEFYVAGLNGRIIHVARATNTTTIVTDESASREVLTGVKYDPQTHQLYVTAAISGRAFIYKLAQNSSTTVSRRVVLQLSRNGGYINDVAVGQMAVFFTDSVKPTLYSVPRRVRPGQIIAVSRYDLGPGFTGVSPLGEAANGIVEAAPGILIFTHFSEGNLYRLAVHNGSSVGRPLLLQLPAVDGKKVNPDGLWLAGKAGLWVADNFNNRLLKVGFGSTDYTSATVECVVTSPAFNTPTTLTTQGNYLWVVNARFLDCLFFKPCLQQPYEIVGEKLSKLCV